MPDTLPTYSAIYAFGDSLSDAGNDSIPTDFATIPFPVSPPYFQEQYGSTSANVFSNGPNWIQNLSIALGLGTLLPSLTGGNDFAYGGATTGSTPQDAYDPAIQAISLPSQLTQLQLAQPHPSSSALYTVSIGSIDVLDVLSSSGLSAQQQSNDVNDAVSNEVSFVNQLVSDGATKLLVLDVPDLGKVPDVTSGMIDGGGPSAALVAEASQLSSQYDTSLISQLGTLASSDGVNVNVVAAYGLIDNAVANPAAYALTNVTTPVWSGGYSNATSGTLAATGAAAQDQYLFFDQLHPTETGQQAIADQAEQQLGGSAALAVQDTTTNQPLAPAAQPYTGPVGVLQQDYINITPDSLNITATTPNWFIHSGGGTDAIAVSTGTNVLDGGTGSNFLTGGSGTDTFFVDDRGAPADIWSTIVNFHAGDAVTLWGITQAGFALNIADDQGVQGYTGLTFHDTALGQAIVSVTIVGATSSELASGQLSVSYGTDPASDSPYMYIHANS